jgi:hypothetical protein
MNWEAISAVSTLIGTLIIVVTAIFAVMQLKEAEKARRLALIIKLFEELSSQDTRSKRLFIYSEIPENPRELTSEHFLVIDKVLSMLDLIWLLIEQDQIDQSYIFDAYGQVFIRLWVKLSPIIQYERNRRGGYYRKSSEKLIKQAQKYFRNKGEPTQYALYAPTKTDSANKNADGSITRNESNPSVPDQRDQISQTTAKQNKGLQVSESENTSELLSRLLQGLDSHSGS